ncbi:hypothetical protein [Virgibacillus subterraneus]|uniref:hypothetical protein n=1 Tax=Virgibacillus subterraneus TaxID=621109 RepID=UPI000B892159|nr:hypothetical protein [Virgibacillus subterraneus]
MKHQQKSVNINRRASTSTEKHETSTEETEHRQRGETSTEKPNYQQKGKEHQQKSVSIYKKITTRFTQ